MTRGHWHENRECVEFYFCIAGEGLLMLMDEDGTTWAEKTYPGTLHHIDGHLALSHAGLFHRINEVTPEKLRRHGPWIANQIQL